CARTPEFTAAGAATGTANSACHCHELNLLSLESCYKSVIYPFPCLCSRERARVTQHVFLAFSAFGLLPV
ncbi:hypothetical protein ATANTOWER_004261, partial [Ataeniobius toweri]|nr:hypothetical protein [Ataeniobius toweri]